MAGCIFFTDTRVWSSSSVGFADIIERAAAKCRENEDLLVQALWDAESIRSLDINLCTTRSLQLRLTERVLEAAQDKLQELCADAATHPDDIKILEELVLLARTHLNGLTTSST